MSMYVVLKNIDCIENIYFAIKYEEQSQ